MCCTLEPSHVSKTILSCIETRHPDHGRVIHVAGYQNKASSDQPGPNAMLLPFPSRVLMGPENVLDTRLAKSILKDYAEAIQPRRRGLMRGGPRLKSLSYDDDVQVFESGSYHIVLARNAAAIPAALNFVRWDKRPRVKQDIFDRYAEFYPAASWQLALCCWNGSVDAEPMMWHYEPNDLETLFFPALDAHDGRPPVLSSTVGVDHTLVVGSTLRELDYANSVEFTDNLPSNLKPFVAKAVIGEQYDKRLQNGDWQFNVGNFATYRRGSMFERVPPPSA